MGEWTNKDRVAYAIARDIREDYPAEVRDEVFGIRLLEQALNDLEEEVSSSPELAPLSEDIDELRLLLEDPEALLDLYSESRLEDDEDYNEESPSSKKAFAARFNA